MGKGLIRRGDVPTPKKKKDVVLRRKRSITIDDNVFSDLDEAFEYAKQVSIEETEQRELKRRTKRRHARIMLERQVNKEVDEVYLLYGSAGVRVITAAGGRSYKENSRFKRKVATDSDNDDDQTEDFVIKLHDKEPKQPPKTLPTLSASVTTTSSEDYKRYLNDPKDVQNA
ncbi:hypothetical protein Tco_1175484 [Tanacetum coccineum]